MAGSGKSQILAARETFGILQEISRLLNTGLDAETLAICVRLCESGVNPEAVAVVVKELRRERSLRKVHIPSTTAEDKELRIE